MSGPVTFFGTTVSGGVRFLCLTGYVMPAEQIGFLQRGTHRLVAADGRVLATLSSDQVDLSALAGQWSTVCGIDEGEIEGVPSLQVTQAMPAGSALTLQHMPFQQIDLRTMVQQMVNARLFG
ncbi:MAG TPA: hypothetical protein VNT01_08040 [Symbiobacteriaceae bacterium]|nr:hypothetical protein [Symbiobacteriaceae bacterium]